MKGSYRFLTGILSLALVFGTITAGCDNGAGGGGVAGDPEITGFSFTQSGGLAEGNSAAAAGAVAGTFGSETGGTAPFTYSLANGDGDTDNTLFTIDGAYLRVGAAALTAGNKSIRVQVRDTKNKTFVKQVIVTVMQAAPPANTGGPTVTLLRDNGKFIVNWTAVEGATGYQIVWAKSTTVPDTLNNNNSADVANILSYTVRNADNGDEYGVWVRARKADTTYSDYSERQSVIPQNLADEKPGKPTVTVTPTDNGQLKIEWNEVQWARNYKVLISERNSITSAAANVVTPANFTELTITTGSDAQKTLPLAGVTGLEYYVWVVALNTVQETESDSARGTIIDAPANKAVFDNTIWKSTGGATYTFTSNDVVYKTMSGESEGEGTYAYNKPTLTLTITASGGQHPEWTIPGPYITVKGKTFTINNVTFTRQ